MTVSMLELLTQWDPEATDLDRQVVKVVCTHEPEEVDVVNKLGAVVEEQSGGRVDRSTVVKSIGAGTVAAGVAATWFGLGAAVGVVAATTVGVASSGVGRIAPLIVALVSL